MPSGEGEQGPGHLQIGTVGLTRLSLAQTGSYLPGKNSAYVVKGSAVGMLFLAFFAAGSRFRLRLE